MPLDYSKLNHKYDVADPIPKEDVSEYKPTGNKEEDCAYYLGQLRRILETGPFHGNTPEPGILLPGLYVGNTAHAQNLGLLKKLGITHVFCCEGVVSRRPDREFRYFEHKIEYDEIPAENGEFYDIGRHFSRAHLYIDQARSRGKVLVFCSDVDRSGAIMISYLMRKGTALINAAKLFKNTRRVGMFNRGFMKQLVKDAWDHHMLHMDRPHMSTTGTSRVKHMPRFQLCLRI